MQPLFIFPRRKMSDLLENGAPEEAIYESRSERFRNVVIWVLVTRLRAGRPRNWGSISGKSKGFFSSL